MYAPYDVRISEEEEIIAIFEPDEYLEEMFKDENDDWFVELDIEYDDEEEEPLLGIFIGKGEKRNEIGMLFPYGEAWEALAEKGTITLVLLDKTSLEKGDFSRAVSLSMELDQYFKGYIEGASHMWESVEDEVGF